MQKSFKDRVLFFLLGSKLSPYQHTHHGVLLLGGVGYLACSVFNFLLKTSDIILVYIQFSVFLTTLVIWYFSRWQRQYHTMAIVFIFLTALVALPFNWVYNAGLSGPTYFLNLCTLAYISVAFRDFGVYRTIGQVLTIVTPLALVFLDLYRPELVFTYPNGLAKALDLSFSFVVTCLLLLLMMKSYSQRYRLERDKAESLAQQLRVLSEQDALTGLHNRRAMDRYIRNYQQESLVFSLGILDLDHFKKLNDQWGHSYGDEVLCQFSSLLNTIALEHKGLAVRLGGEEFVLLLPFGSEQALTCYQKLSDQLNEAELAHGSITFSAGLIAAKQAEPQDILLERADKLLYAAKHAGRNRIYTDTVPKLESC